MFVSIISNIFFSLEDLCSLSNCLVTEIRLENEKCLLTCLCRSPGQNHHEFEHFCTNLDTLMDHINFLPALFLLEILMLDAQIGAIMILPTQNGRALDTITPSAGYKQNINKPTHTVNNSFFYIDLIFCDNLNLISNYGVHLSKFEKCHHNIIFGKINIRIPLPPSYAREILDYRKANVKSIRKVIQSFDWIIFLFGNISVDWKINVLNETLMNIFRNYSPNKKVKCNYCQPPWMNDKIKKCLRERSKLAKFYYKHGQKKEDQEKLQAKAAYCTEEILKAKNDYILRMTSKLNDLKAAPQTYCQY